MTENNFSLSYDFFFLFRRDAHELEDILPLPNLSRKDLMGNGIFVDEDKILISRSYAQQPLDESLKLMVKAWQDIVERHQKAIIPENAKKIEEVCQAALLGMAMVIMDDSLDSHTLTIENREISRQSSSIIFKRSQQTLFTLNKEENTTSFEPFTAYFADGACKSRYPFSLVFQDGEVFLKPILGEEILDKETTKAPVFAMYGIEHPGVGKSFKTESWPKELQQILGGKGKNSQDLPLLVPVISRLLMRQWQFTRMDCAATRLRGDLQKVVSYRQLSQAELICRSNHQLGEDLAQVIDKHTVDVKHLQARLLQAIRTLQINLNNLNKRLKEIQPRCQAQNWQFIGQDSLVETFERDMRTLENHQSYLTGEMLHSEGLHQRWHLLLDGRRLALSEHLGTLGHILILLVALGEVANMTTQSHNNTVTPPTHEVVKNSECPKFLDEIATTQLHDNATESNIHETTKSHENSKSPVGWLDKYVKIPLHSIGFYLLVIFLFVGFAIVPPVYKRVTRVCFCWRYKKHNRKVSK
ncbi:MAG: hypothetical protein BWK78_09560 [Thiotrichaceae bacterium IS1]|nr:MAG: hypothetical protein BWK78_09560 [Thiotrichaceae bacterium IS1]